KIDRRRLPQVGAGARAQGARLLGIPEGVGTCLAPRRPMTTTPTSPRERPASWPPFERRRVSPAEICAARQAREAARAAALQTRRLVLTIWLVAFGLGLGLAVAAISSP